MHTSWHLLARCSSVRCKCFNGHPAQPKKVKNASPRWLADHPQDARTRAVLAESLIKRGQYNCRCGRQYLLLKQQQPGQPDDSEQSCVVALHESATAAHLSFAEQALKLNPDNAAVLDTYGWLQVRMGNAAKGL